MTTRPYRAGEKAFMKPAPSPVGDPPDQNVDPVWSLSECAYYLKLNVGKARRRIRESGITPVRTTTGVGYRQADIRVVAASLSGERA